MCIICSCTKAVLCNYFSGLACCFFQFTLYSKSFVLLVPGVDEEESVTTEAAESLVAPGEEAMAVPSLVVSSWLAVLSGSCPMPVTREILELSWTYKYKN